MFAVCAWRPLLAGAVAAALALLIGAAGTLDAIEREAVDARFALRGTEPAPEVAVVDLDHAGIRALGGRWPLRRTVHARLIDALRRAGVRRIAYDIEFSRPSRRPGDDAALLAAMGRARGVVLASMPVAGRGPHTVLGGAAQHRRVGARAASAVLPDDPGGVMRRMPWAQKGVPPLATAVAAAEGRRASGSSRTAWIDYAGPPGAVLTVPFERVLRSPGAAAALRGRIVVVGSSATRLGDRHAAPTSGAGRMPGPEIQANAIATAARLPAVLVAAAASGPLTQPARARRAGRGRREAVRGV